VKDLQLLYGYLNVRMVSEWNKMVRDKTERLVAGFTSLAQIVIEKTVEDSVAWNNFNKNICTVFSSMKLDVE